MDRRDELLAICIASEAAYVDKRLHRSARMRYSSHRQYRGERLPFFPGGSRARLHRLRWARPTPATFFSADAPRAARSERETLTHDPAGSDATAGRYEKPDVQSGTAPAAPCPLGFPRLRDRSTRCFVTRSFAIVLEPCEDRLGRGHSTRAVDPVCGTGVDRSCCSVTAVAVAEFDSCGQRTIASRPAPRDRPRALTGLRAATGPGKALASRWADRQ